MEKSNHQRFKLLIVYNILLRETDEKHPITVNQLTERLQAQGISCDRRTLARDMRIFNESGIEVMSVRVGHAIGYYIEDRDFSVSELKILVDAVQAATFITPKKSDELIEKISALGGASQSEIIRSNNVAFSSRKHSNETIFTTVSQLADAIDSSKKVRIRSFNLGVDGSRIYRHGGEFYTIEPLRLCFKEDNYYVICYDDRHGIMSRRVDRIDRVEVLDEMLSADALAHRSGVGKYSGRVFRMYGGREVTVELEFKERITEQLFDRFGEDLRVKPSENGLFRTKVDVEISPTFWGWLFTYAGDLRIVSPESAVDEYKERLAIMNGITE